MTDLIERYPGELNDLRAEVDKYAHMLDEIVVALGSLGLSHSEVIKEIERQAKRIAELETKIKEGNGPIISWLTDEMNKVKPLQARVEKLEGAGSALAREASASSHYILAEGGPSNHAAILERISEFRSALSAEQR